MAQAGAPGPAGPGQTCGYAGKACGRKGLKEHAFCFQHKCSSVIGGVCGAQIFVSAVKVKGLYRYCEGHLCSSRDGEGVTCKEQRMPTRDVCVTHAQLTDPINPCPVPEQTAECMICMVDDVAVSEGIYCKGGAVPHFMCNNCFGHRIATHCTAPYNTFQAEDMHVYCFAPMLGIECNAVHPQTNLAFTLLDMAVHGNDAPERGLVAFLKAREEIKIAQVLTPMDAEIDRLNQLLAAANLKAGAPAHLVKRLALKIMNEALIISTPCCQTAYIHDSCSAVSTSECCNLQNVKFCGLCMEMFVESSADSEQRTHYHLANDCKYNLHKTDRYYPRPSSKEFARRSIYRERVLSVLRADGLDGGTDDDHNVQRAVLEVVRVDLTDLDLNVDNMITELTGYNPVQMIGDDSAVLRAWREQCPKLRELWEESVPVPAWLGVTFGEAGGAHEGRVVKIALGEKGLTGNVPAWLGRLTALTELKLEDNRLTSVPGELGALTALTHLNLGGNKLTSVKAVLGGLTALTRLQLNNNRLKSVPAAIGGLTALMELRLSKNQLTTLPVEIGRLTALTKLGLSKNQLTIVPAAIGGLTALTALDLTGNQLTSVPEELGGLTALMLLGLGGNLLSSIPAGLGRLTVLTRLYFDGNNLTSMPAEWEMGGALERSGCRIRR